jgi:Ser/Thr protein kinase RdoA (MazF antagonist)
VTSSTFQTVTLTALGCIAAAFAVLHLRARKHDREQFRRDEQWRERLWSQATGASMPYLTGEEQAEFKALATRLKRQADTGLAILDREGDNR